MSVFKSNRAVLRAKVYHRLGLPETDTFIDSTIANEMLNQALHQVDLAHPWPWCVTQTFLGEDSTTTAHNGPNPPVTVFTVGGVYVMPSDYVAMLSISTGDAGPNMRYVERRPYDDVRLFQAACGTAGATTGSIPAMWAEYEHGTIIVAPNPAPDVRVLCRYRCTSVDLTDDALMPRHPAYVDEVYVAYAAYLCGLRVRELAETGGSLAQFEAILERYKQVYPAPVGEGMMPLPPRPAAERG